MKINTPLRLGVGFPGEKLYDLDDLLAQISQYFSSRSYSQEINLLCIWIAVYKPEHVKKNVPKPRIKKAKTIKTADYPGWPKDWPDTHTPENLELHTYVDFDTAAQASGSTLRHALVDPICATLLQTPKTIQQRIRIQDLIMDLQIWADLSD
jgi:hypothetical protein